MFLAWARLLLSIPIPLNLRLIMSKIYILYTCVKFRPDVLQYIIKYFNFKKSTCGLKTCHIKITSVNMHAVICVHKTQAWICFDVCVSWHFVDGQSIMNKIQGYICLLKFNKNCSSTVRQNYVILLVREVIFLMLMVLPMQKMQWLEEQSLTYCMLKSLFDVQMYCDVIYTQNGQIMTS